MAHDWKIEDKIKLEIMMRGQNMLRRLITFYFAGISIAALIFVPYKLYISFFIESNGHERIMFVLSEFFLDAKISPIFELIWLGQVVTCLAIGFIFVSYDELFFIIVIHLCDQLKILKLDISNLMPLQEDQTFAEAIKPIVQRHVQLKR